MRAARPARGGAPSGRCRQADVRHFRRGDRRPLLLGPGRRPHGLAAGDAICHTLAAAAGLTHAALFRAWLSTSSTDAYCHVAGFAGKKSNQCGQSSLPDAGPWERTDGVSFSHLLSDLTTSFDVLHPPYVDENGNVAAGGPRVFTGTDWDGRLLDPTFDCNNWQSAAASDRADIGGVEYGATGWTGRRLDACSGVFRLYCFDPGTGGALSGSGSAPGAWVFVTSASGTADLGAWPEAAGRTGLAAGDAICRSAAASGHLPAADTYVAWLSIAGSPASTASPRTDRSAGPAASRSRHRKRTS